MYHIQIENAHLHGIKVQSLRALATKCSKDSGELF